MPIHDWTRVEAGIFHHFHLIWLGQISHALNGGVLPHGYYALAEQITGDFVPDVLTLQRPEHDSPRRSSRRKQKDRSGGVAVADAPPKAGLHSPKLPRWYAEHKKKSIAIRHITENRIVAVLEIVSPGNKSSAAAMKSFVNKSRTLLAAGIHLTVVDLCPPNRRSAKGIHSVIWGKSKLDVPLDASEPLTCVSYIAGDEPAVMVKTMAVGKPLPDARIYLTPEQFVLAPLEKTYRAAFVEVPDFLRDILNQKRSARPAT
jgi:Protein of unknown function (DUF4058)